MPVTRLSCILVMLVTQFFFRNSVILGYYFVFNSNYVQFLNVIPQHLKPFQLAEFFISPVLNSFIQIPAYSPCAFFLCEISTPFTLKFTRN